jgi:hypothetical protein
MRYAGLRRNFVPRGMTCRCFLCPSFRGPPINHYGIVELMDLCGTYGIMDKIPLFGAERSGVGRGSLQRPCSAVPHQKQTCLCYKILYAGFCSAPYEIPSVSTSGFPKFEKKKKNKVQHTKLLFKTTKKILSQVDFGLWTDVHYLGNFVPLALNAASLQKFLGLPFGHPAAEYHARRNFVPPAAGSNAAWLLGLSKRSAGSSKRPKKYAGSSAKLCSPALA